LWPVRITRSEPVADLSLPEGFGGAHGKLAGGGRPAIEVARLEPKPGRAVRVLMSSKNDGPVPFGIPFIPGESLVVQAPYGLGRVTVVALDVEQKPFADW